jgi:signal transduction histidine kinase
VTLSRDEDGGVIGHTLVFSDFSGEEERIKTAATRTILERVPYGLFVLDANGCMKSGYSDACLNMFPGAGSASLVGRSLTSLLGLDARSKSQFELCYQQVVEDLLPSDVALGQLPKQVPVGRKTFRLDGALVRTAEDAVDGVLFTMLDITEQVDAERETERQKATVAVLRFRDSFETFALELGASLDALISGEGGELGQEHVRALLHTAKGVFGQFALSDLAAEIHRIEDQETIDQGTLSALRDSFHAVLRENRDIWHIELTASAPTYVATEAFVSDLERRVRATRDGDSLRALVLAELQSMREKSAAELLGPVALGAADLAVRRGKASVDVSISGGETRVPLEMAGVLATLVHLVRNAVDHGIEGADERGEKPAVAKIDIKVGRTERELHVVVADDGKGIDSERVVARAVEMGAVDKETAASLTEDERLQLVFVGGLSTSEAVTETSGRGVGVGATKAAVESVGGKLHVSTRRGHGTTFTLVLPIGAAPHDAVVQSAAE